MPKVSRSLNLPPGTPVYVGQERKEPVQITLIDYDQNNFLRKSITDIEDCFPFHESPSVTWIDMEGVHDPEIIRILGEKFGFHPLVLEDIVNTSQRAKVEDYGQHVYVVIKMLRWDDEKDEMIIEQVSLIVGPNFVFSFQEVPGDVFDEVRERLRTGKGRIRAMGADYLAYALLDAIVDGYFRILENLGEKIEELQYETITAPTKDTLRQIYRLRQEALVVRRCVWPARELASGLERLESPLISRGLKPYIRDLYDHVVQAIDTTETFREMLSVLLDTYLSSLSNRLNEVMKVLTIIATIFMPLTFVVGLYGMNFHYMPELSWRYGYLFLWGILLAVTITMLFYFRRKGWL